MSRISRILVLKSEWTSSCCFFIYIPGPVTVTQQPRDLLGSELTVHYSRRSNNLHDWENLWEDNARFSQVLVQNSLVKVIGGIFDLGGLENHSGSVLPNTAGNKNHRIQSTTICHGSQV